MRVPAEDLITAPEPESTPLAVPEPVIEPPDKAMALATV